MITNFGERIRAYKTQIRSFFDLSHVICGDFGFDFEFKEIVAENVEKNKSHSSGFYYIVIENNKNKKKFHRFFACFDKNKFSSTILMSWTFSKGFQDLIHLPAGARPATFCFDSSSDIFNGF